MALKLPPSAVTEIGSPGITSFGGFLETWEETPELQWPNSLLVYDRMRRTDGHIASILRALTLPIRRARWHLEGDDVREEVTTAVQTELGLNPRGRGRRRRRRQGISWDPFLRHALLHLPLGFMPFEQVYEIGPPAPGLEGAFPHSEVAHIRKLAPRMPRTISGFELEPDGGLKALRQWVGSRGSYEEKTLELDRLVMFVNDQEGSDWLGNSILRAAYKHWLVKDLLVRLGPMAVERNGMGLPVVTYPQGGDRELALAIATNVRAGEDAGVAVPDGYVLELIGVTGSVRDELPLIHYHDQESGRNALAMFLDLGHDRGARSLGETFVDYFLMSLEAVADFVGEIVTEYVIADWVRLNFGEDEAYPDLIADGLEATSAPTADALKALADAGIIVADDPLEDDVRERYHLPPRAGTPEGPPDEGVDDIVDVPSGDEPEMPPDEPQEPESGPEPSPLHPGPDKVPVKPHVRRRPGRAPTIQEAERRLEAAQRRLHALKAR